MAVFAVLAALVLTSCGGAWSDCASASKPPLIVSAAASLKTAFTAYGERFAAARRARFSFAGSDELGRPDPAGRQAGRLRVAPNTKLPDQLYAKELVDKPVVFATNRLVLAVPERTPKLLGIDDLAEPGHEDRDRLGDRCRSAPTRARCSPSSPGDEAKAILAQRALQRARRRGHRRQAHAGRGRRRLRLHHRRDGDGGRAEGDRAAGASCSRGSPTGSRW